MMMESTIFVIGGIMLILMLSGIGISIKEFSEMEDERPLDQEPDYIDYDGIGNQGRFVKDRYSRKAKRNKNNRRTNA